jgi:hypothetical protein
MTEPRQPDALLRFVWFITCAASFGAAAAAAVKGRPSAGFGVALGVAAFLLFLDEMNRLGKGQ